MNGISTLAGSLLLDKLKGTVTRFYECAAFWFLVWRAFFSKLAFDEEILLYRPWGAWESYNIGIEELLGPFWNFQTSYFVFHCQRCRDFRGQWGAVHEAIFVVVSAATNGSNVRLTWSSGFHFCLMIFPCQWSTYTVNGKFRMKVENWFPRYGHGLTNGTQRQVKRLSIVCKSLIHSLVCEIKRKPSNLYCAGSLVRLKERIRRTWQVFTDIRFTTPICSYTKQK